MPRTSKRKKTEFTPYIGMTVKKNFVVDDELEEEEFEGVVVFAPLVDDENPNDDDYHKWKVEYSDGEEHKYAAEDLEEMEIDLSDVKDKGIRKLAVKLLNPRKVPSDINAKYGYNDAKRELLYLMGTTEEDVVAALDQMEGPQYGLNEAMNIIHKARNDAANAMGNYEEQTGYFVPAPGTRLRVCYRGAQYHGTVMKQVMRKITLNVPHFEVLDDDGERMDMTAEEVGHWRACRPIKPNPCRSRQLNALEMFSGKSMISQEFHKKLYGVRSFDRYDYLSICI